MKAKVQIIWRTKVGNMKGTPTFPVYLEEVTKLKNNLEQIIFSQDHKIKISPDTTKVNIFLATSDYRWDLESLMFMGIAGNLDIFVQPQPVPLRWQRSPLSPSILQFFTPPPGPWDPL